MDIRRSFLLAIALLSAALAFGPACANSPRVHDAPLAESSQKELKRTLLGSWTHTHTIQKSGQRTPVEGATVTWTFNPDGTGVYRQKVSSSGTDETWKFSWELEGRNIVLDQKGGNRKAFYRADTWSPRQMQWFNYMDEKSYVVRKQ
mgnify:CR=1 FL=1